MQKLRIRLKAFDSKVLDESVKKIIEVLQDLDAEIKGPVPLPTKIEKYTILRSVHKHKDSREQFERRTHTRLMDIYNPNNNIINKLKELSLPSSVNIEIKF